MPTIAHSQRLPRAENVADASLAPSCRILIVDDDEFFLDFIVKLFNRAGYASDTASDGLAGWEALKKKPYDLLITDYKMPKMTGSDLIRKVRAVSDIIPCILMSSALPTSEPDLATIVMPGAILQKTFSFAGLVPKVKALLFAAGQAAEVRQTRLLGSAADDDDLRNASGATA